MTDSIYIPDEQLPPATVIARLRRDLTNETRISLDYQKQRDELRDENDRLRADKQRLDYLDSLRKDNQRWTMHEWTFDEVLKAYVGLVDTKMRDLAFETVREAIDFRRVRNTQSNAIERNPDAKQDAKCERCGIPHEMGRVTCETKILRG
jgi:hypothetical protein